MYHTPSHPSARCVSKWVVCTVRNENKVTRFDSDNFKLNTIQVLYKCSNEVMTLVVFSIIKSAWIALIITTLNFCFVTVAVTFPLQDPQPLEKWDGEYLGKKIQWIFQLIFRLQNSYQYFSLWYLNSRWWRTDVSAAKFNLPEHGRHWHRRLFAFERLRSRNGKIWALFCFVLLAECFCWANSFYIHRKREQTPNYQCLYGIIMVPCYSARHSGRTMHRTFYLTKISFWWQAIIASVHLDFWARRTNMRPETSDSKINRWYWNGFKKILNGSAVIQTGRDFVVHAVYWRGF